MNGADEQVRGGWPADVVDGPDADARSRSAAAHPARREEAIARTWIATMAGTCKFSLNTAPTKMRRIVKGGLTRPAHVPMLVAQARSVSADYSYFAAQVAANGKRPCSECFQKTTRQHSEPGYTSGERSVPQQAAGASASRRRPNVPVLPLLQKTM